MSKDAIIPWLYFIIAMATFAWSASDPANKCTAQDYYDNTCAGDVGSMVTGVVAGIGWPFYWAWVAAEKIRGEES